MKARELIILAVLLAASSCGSEVESSFVRSADAPRGIYSLSVDLSDSLSSYDLSLYTRIEEPVTLEVSWVSPSLEVPLTDTVVVCPDRRKGVEVLYRSGVCPSEKGVWTLRIRPLPEPEGFSGVGVVTRKY